MKIEIVELMNGKKSLGFSPFVKEKGQKTKGFCNNEGEPLAFSTHNRAKTHATSYIRELIFSRNQALIEVQAMCNGIQYSRNIPEEAKELAAENNIIVIVEGSDDLMYCYGAKSYLTDRREHSCGWDGEAFESEVFSDTKLFKEAKQLGLKIWWCGEIKDQDLKIEGYDVEKSGAFSYTVNPEINHLNFLVMEDNDVYCTGIAILLPEGFKISK